MSKTYCIGDVHGCYYTLISLIEKLPKDAELIFLGDLCDKGNFVKEVYDFVIKNKHIVIKGNHETFLELYLEDAIKKGTRNIWSINPSYGGSKTVDNYLNNEEKMYAHLEFIKSMPNYLIRDNFFITHGFGLPYFKQRDDNHKALQWNRVERAPKSDYEDYSNYNIINIFGHSAFKEVLFHEKYIGIDTGAVYGGKLTALELGTKNIIQQKTIIKDII